MFRVWYEEARGFVGITYLEVDLTGALLVGSGLKPTKRGQSSSHLRLPIHFTVTVTPTAIIKGIVSCDSCSCTILDEAVKIPLIQPSCAYNSYDCYYCCTVTIPSMMQGPVWD